MLKNTAFSVLDLAPIRRGDSIAQTLAYSLTQAQHVEQLGFTRYWLAEHHNMDGIASSATSLLISYIAQGTQRIRVGSGGIMLPNHPPLVIAEQFGTLAALYGDRIDLGLGRAPGSDPYTSHALRRGIDTAAHFPQEVAELERLLGPKQANAKVQATPGTGSNVPIWLLGSSLFSAQLAGMKGLPYAFAAHFAPQQLDEALKVYRHYFTPSAQLAEPYVMVGVPLLLAPSMEEASYLATSVYQRILNLMRGQSLIMQPPIESMAGLWQPHEEQYVKSFLQMAVLGDPTQGKERLEAIIARTGANELMFTCDFFEPAHRLRSYSLAAELRANS